MREMVFYMALANLFDMTVVWAKRRCSVNMRERALHGLVN